MNNWWFSADPHFDHDEIIKHCNRPYSDVNEMNEAILDAYNSCVLPQDVFVICGDFCLGTYNQAQSFLKRINGNKILLKGNHDHWWKGTKRHAYNKRIGDALYLYCSHYPYRAWARYHTNGWNICGHSHAKLEPLPNQYDVGVDCATRDFGVPRPYNIEDLNKLIKPYVKED